MDSQGEIYVFHFKPKQHDDILIKRLFSRRLLLNGIWAGIHRVLQVLRSLPAWASGPLRALAGSISPTYQALKLYSAAIAPGRRSASAPRWVDPDRGRTFTQHPAAIAPSGRVRSPLALNRDNKFLQEAAARPHARRYNLGTTRIRLM